jgi:hypothetical protein
VSGAYIHGKRRQPLEWEYDHEQPSIPQTYFEGWYEGHNSLTLSIFADYTPAKDIFTAFHKLRHIICTILCDIIP